MSFKPIECPKCGAMLRSKYEVRTEAIEHDVNTVPDSGDFERVEIDGWWYVPERTYHPERISTAYHSAIVCSECKHLLEGATIYCPYCGARLEGVGR